jgi:predicted nucleic acid-binding protein
MSVEFVDSNILIYAHAKDAGERHARSEALITRLADEGAGALSVQVLCEFYSIATKKLRMREEYVEQVIRNLAFWNIHRPGHSDILQAISLQRRHKLSWWDALVINSAIECGADILWSEDLQAGRRFGEMTIRNPFK